MPKEGWDPSHALAGPRGACVAHWGCPVGDGMQSWMSEFISMEDSPL